MLSLLIQISKILGKWRTPDCIFYLVRWLDSHTDTWERAQLVNTFTEAVEEWNEWMRATGQEPKIRKRGGFRPEARDTNVPHFLTEAMLSNVFDVKTPQKAATPPKKESLDESMTSTTSNESERRVSRRQPKEVKEAVEAKVGANGDEAPRRQSPRTSPKTKKMAKHLAATKSVRAAVVSKSEPDSSQKANNGVRHTRSISAKPIPTSATPTSLPSTRNSSPRTLISSDSKRARQPRSASPPITRKRTASLPLTANIDEPRPKRSKAVLVKAEMNDSFDSKLSLTASSSGFHSHAEDVLFH